MRSEREQGRWNVRWDDFPVDRALAWCRVFFDFPPHFPGASFMNFGYHAYRSGRPPGFYAWAQTAREGEAAGFTPDLYYTLQLTLKVITPDSYPTHPAHARIKDSSGRMQSALDLREWGLWADLVQSGSTPLTATREILSGGRHGTRGFLVDLGRGTVVSTDDAGGG